MHIDLSVEVESSLKRHRIIEKKHSQSIGMRFSFFASALLCSQDGRVEKFQTLNLLHAKTNKNKLDADLFSARHLLHCLVIDWKENNSCC